MADQQYPLYHPEMEHESCGVGAIVDMSGRATHHTVDQALTIVERLAHRAGSDALGKMMPAPPVERTAGNPWPKWPRTLRTDYGQLEAIHRQGADPRVYETTVKRRLSGAIETVKPRGLDPIPGTEQVLPCDLLLIAAGFISCEESTATTFGVTRNKRGCMMPDDGSHHLRDNLFSAGDMHTGQSLVVRALADGQAAVEEIYAWLMKTKGRNT